MLIASGDGTFIGGPFDVILILRDVTTGRFHPAFAQEAPMPGPIPGVKDTPFVRLRSWGHHTEGFATLEEAQANLRADLAQKILLPPENIVEAPVDWNGQVFTALVENWRKAEPAGRPRVQHLA